MHMSNWKRCLPGRVEYMEKILGMIGLAKRARALCAGGFLSEDAIKSGNAKFVIIASDASDRSKKNIINSCEYYKVPYVEFSDMQSLGKVTGGGEKSVLAVTDMNFAKALKEKIGAVQRKDR